ncbi:hypothetical protein JCM8547_000123 [Rhodosporidiobolus lusitaniae]
MSSTASAPRVAQADETRNWVAIYGTPVSHTVAPKLFDVIFPAIGLPKFKYTYVDCPSLEEEGNAWETAVKTNERFLGSCVTMPLKIQAVSKVDELTPQAAAIGSVNTTFLRPSPSSPSGFIHVGTNLDTAGVKNSLLTALLRTPSPFPSDAPKAFAPDTAAALMIGGGGATRAALWAMNELGLSPIFLVNRDPVETAAIIAQFPALNLRALTSVEEAEKELDELESRGVKLAAGTGAIPSIEPQTEGEKMVYEVAKAVFARDYKKGEKETTAGSIALPEKPVCLEMAYKPRMTIMRRIAEERGWATICGVEVVLEGCFEQAKLWTGKEIPLDVREAGRKVLREE